MSKMVGMVNGSADYPMVPGHELAGIVSAVGDKVTKFKVGDQIGVGCFVDSCLECDNCKAGKDNYCMKAVFTYQGKDAGRGRTDLPPPPNPQHTLGGYTTKFVVHERFATPVPKTYPLKYVGPMMCAGVTMFSPLQNLGAGPGKKVAIVGLGGLGMCGIQLAKAMGAEVVAISRSEKKKALAVKCGASGYILSGDAAAMAAANDTFDIVLNTIPSYPNYELYHPLVGKGGKQVLLGISAWAMPCMVISELMHLNRSLTGSGIGSIKQSIELMQLVDEHKIYPEVELFPASDLNKVYTKLDQNEGGMRYVMETETIKLDAQTGDAPSVSPNPGDINPGSVFSKLLFLLCFGPRAKGTHPYATDVGLYN